MKAIPVFATWYRFAWVFRLFGLVLLVVLWNVGVPPFKWLLMAVTLFAATYMEVQIDRDKAALAKASNGEPCVVHFIRDGEVIDVLAGHWTREADKLVFHHSEGQEDFDVSSLRRLSKGSSGYQLWLDEGDKQLRIQRGYGVNGSKAKQVFATFDDLPVHESPDEISRMTQAVETASVAPILRAMAFFYLVMTLHLLTKGKYESAAIKGLLALLVFILLIPMKKAVKDSGLGAASKSPERKG